MRRIKKSQYEAIRRIRKAKERSAGSAGGVVSLGQLCRAIEVSRQSYYAHIQTGDKRELLESLMVGSCVSILAPNQHLRSCKTCLITIPCWGN